MKSKSINKEKCEGCGEEFQRRGIAAHRRYCDKYLDNLPANRGGRRWVDITTLEQDGYALEFQSPKMFEGQEGWEVSVPQRADDPVNHPSHYTFGKFEVIEVLEDWFGSDPLLWQVVKYLARAGRKGPALEDLEKAEFYLKRRVEKEKEGIYKERKGTLS